MIDQTATDYDAPAVYLPRLIAWAEATIERLTEAGRSQTEQGFASNAEAYAGLAREYRAVAVWARCRLVDLSELALDDPFDSQARSGQAEADEPPAPLVDLTDWLRGKLSRHFPLMPSELWQALACVLRPFRRQS